MGSRRAEPLRLNALVPTVPFLLFNSAIFFAFLTVQVSAESCGAEVTSASEPSVRCAASFLNSGVCLPTCCCFKTQNSQPAQVFATGGSCFLERRIDDFDVLQFRVLSYGPTSSGDCSRTSTEGCPSPECVIPGNDSVVLSSGSNPSGDTLPPGSGTDGTTNETNESGDGDGSSSVVAPVAGGLAALSFLVILAWILVVFVRRRRQARESLQPPKGGRIVPDYGDLTLTLSTPTGQDASADIEHSEPTEYSEPTEPTEPTGPSEPTGPIVPDGKSNV